MMTRTDVKGLWMGASEERCLALWTLSSVGSCAVLKLRSVEVSCVICQITARFEQ